MYSNNMADQGLVAGPIYKHFDGRDLRQNSQILDLERCKWHVPCIWSNLISVSGTPDGPWSPAKK